MPVRGLTGEYKVIKANAINMAINMTVQSCKCVHCFTALCCSLKCAQILHYHIGKAAGASLLT